MSLEAPVAGILSHEELRAANRFALVPRRSVQGSVKGERQTRRKGTSIEFADFRNYTEGDDLRHLDWNVLARLDTPVMRTYLDEQDLAVHVILDASASMDFGEPSKFIYARKLALILGLAALNGGDALYGLDPRSLVSTRAMRGRPSAGPWLGLMAEWQPDQNRPIAQVLRTFAASGRRRGIVALASDGLDPDLPAALSVLGSAGFEILFAQVLSRLDLDPDIEGDLRLVDAESDDYADLTANRYAVRTYAANLQAHLSKLEAAVRRVGGRFIRLVTDEPIETIALRRLERDGWVRR